MGSCRAETIVDRNFDPYVGDGQPYCGFYTQQEIREVVAWAAARYITILPEIEMPGHSVAALAAYPELACTPGPFQVSTRWGVTEDIYCPSERTFGFLQDVLTEVMRLFPGRYIHVGGDEAPKRAWQKSELAQQLIRREGLHDGDALQSWFIRRIERFLSGHGRRLIGWDEILEGGIAPEATVMSWRGIDGGIAAARQGHDVIMTPDSHVYFDYYQGDPAGEPLAIGGFTPLDRVYGYEPVPPELSAAEAAHILGTQGNVWTEYMKTTDYVEYMVMPRMLALSEVQWSPRERRNYSDFLQRLPAQLLRLDAAGVHYRVPDVVGLESDAITLEPTVHVTLSVPLSRATIRYTTDGSDPSTASALYASPFDLPVSEQPVTVAARAFLADGRSSAIRRASFTHTTLREPDPVREDVLAPGLCVDQFEGSFRRADDVRARSPLRTVVSPLVQLPADIAAERFGLRYTGYLHAPADGIYTLYLSSDDGSRLRIGSSLVVDNDGAHGEVEKSGQIALHAGWHALEVDYFQAGGGKALSLAMASTGSAKHPVNATQLACLASR